MADYQMFTERLIQWMKDQVYNAKAQGVVVGMSGGIDSAVVSVLCKKAFPNNTLGLIMPCHSNPQDAKDAKLVAEKFNIGYHIVDLSTTFDSLIEAAGGTHGLTKSGLALNNTKPRLRMTTLYYFAGINNALVVGTDNLSELKVGYFTKYGDGGVDIVPLGTLVKVQVRELARYLQIPESIITKVPTAGLWENQTDEGEMGVTYEELDNYILTGEAEPRIKEIIDHLYTCSRHKLSIPPKPDFGIE